MELRLVTAESAIAMVTADIDAVAHGAHRAAAPNDELEDTYLGHVQLARIEKKLLFFEQVIGNVHAKVSAMQHVGRIDARLDSRLYF